jgi:hypothetical protein
VQFLKGAGAQLESLATQFDFGALNIIAESINRTLEHLLTGLALIEECCELDDSARIREEVARKRFPDQPEMMEWLSQLSEVMTIGPGLLRIKPRDMEEKLADLNALAQIRKIKGKGKWMVQARGGWLVNSVGFYDDPPRYYCNLDRKLEDEELMILNKHIMKGVSFEAAPPAVFGQAGRLLLPSRGGLEKPVLIQVDLVRALPPHPDYYRAGKKRLPCRGKGALIALSGGNS